MLSSLPTLLPPPSSLLPPLTQSTPHSSSDPASHYHQHHHVHQSRRAGIRPHPQQSRTLPLLSHEERLLSQRKLAIAMYGYSWLKPAGCVKTMLGRREEEVEREEVERQLREVEREEGGRREAEEQERLAHIREMQERGEIIPPAERDLDEDVPDADATVHTLDPADDQDLAEGDEIDLDNEIPEATSEQSDGDEEEIEEEDELEQVERAGSETSGFGEGWTYDSRREPDTDDDEEGVERRLAALTGRNSQAGQHRGRGRGMGDGSSERGVNRVAVARAAAALGVGGNYGNTYSEYFGVDGNGTPGSAEDDDQVEEMLDEDELGELHGNHSDDPYGGVGGPDGDADLDDDIPDADEGAWEHTDSEVEEEMDISLLGPAPGVIVGSDATRTGGSIGTRRSEGFANAVMQRTTPIPADSTRSRRTTASPYTTNPTGPEPRARVRSGNTLSLPSQTQNPQSIRRPTAGDTRTPASMIGQPGLEVEDLIMTGSSAIRSQRESWGLDGAPADDFVDEDTASRRYGRTEQTDVAERGGNWLAASSARRQLFGGRSRGGGGGLFTPSPARDVGDGVESAERDDGAAGHRRRRSARFADGWRENREMDSVD